MNIFNIIYNIDNKMELPDDELICHLRMNYYSYDILLQARNLDQKRKWCREIKRLMLESYSSKIPENVKDLIIQKLGKSKEEEGLCFVTLLHLSHIMRKPALCHMLTRHRSACASVQADQRLCCSLPRQYNSSSFCILCS